MIVIRNLNGTIDFLATREVMLGNPGEDAECLEELEEECPPTQRCVPEPVQAAYEEFWKDPCWAEKPGILG